jgi:hypothetical protein
MLLIIGKVVLGNLEEEIVLVPGNSNWIAFTIRFTSKLLKQERNCCRQKFI